MLRGAIIIGIAGRSGSFLRCWKVKALFGYDDALDTFGVHAVGGTLGAFLTGFSPQPKAVMPTSPTPVQQQRQWSGQVGCRRRTLGRATQSNRHHAGPGNRGNRHHRLHRQSGRRTAADPEVETAGLDLAEHGEEGYHSAGAL